MDFTSKILTLEISGNPEKILAFEQIINKWAKLHSSSSPHMSCPFQ